MRRLPSGLYVPGQVVLVARRFNATQELLAGTISNISFDVVDFDPLDMLDAGGALWTHRWPGRYFAHYYVRFVIPNTVTGGSSYFRLASPSGSYSALARPDRTVTIDQSVAAFGPSQGRCTSGSFGQVEYSQDSGVSGAINEAHLIVSFLGDR